jgi:hypothetical protein
MVVRHFRAWWFRLAGLFTAASGLSSLVRLRGVAHLWHCVGHRHNR